MIIKTTDCLKKFLKSSIKAGTFVLLAAALAACSLPEEPEDAPLKSASSQSVNDALANEVFATDLSKLSQNQMVKYEFNYRAEMSSVLKYLDVTRTVKSVQWDQLDSDVYLKLVMDHLEESWDANGGSSGSLTKEVSRKIQFDSAGQLLGVFALTDEGSGDDPNEPQQEIEYYNLQVEHVTVPAPADTAARPDCGGLQDCSIRGVKVTYLIVVRENGKITQKFKRATVVSREIPPLFFFDEDETAILPVVSDCFTSLYAGAIYLNQCTVLRDIQL